MALFDETNRARLLAPPPHKSVDESLISRALEPFWSWVAELMPPWLSPNAITTSGLLLVVLAFAAMIGLCPGFVGTAPAWAYLFAIASLFAFQTLDAVDGKQARKTKSGSPLGAWMDHACDVVSVQLAMATVATSLGLGTGGLALFLMGSVFFNNYVIHWETKHTGTLFMGNGTSIYEAQVMLMVVHAVTLVMGQGVWRTRLPGIGAELGAVIVVVGVGAVGGLGVVGSLRRVRAIAASRGVPFAPLLADLAPVTVLCLAAGVAHVASRNNRVALTFAASLLGLRLIAKVILEHLADLAPTRLDLTLLPIVASAGALALVHTEVLPASVDGPALGWANLGFALFVCGRFYVMATREIAVVLGIPVFTLPKR